MTTNRNWGCRPELVATALLVLYLAGCALMPSSKKTTADAREAGNASEKHETTLRRASAGVLPPNVTITIGKGGTVFMPAPAVAVPYKETVEFSDDAGMSSESSLSWSKFSKVAIPWGIKLLLAAAGIMALIMAFKYARKSSPAVDAIIGTADAAIAARINQHKEHAMAATDPALIAHHNARMASLQEDRVNLVKSKPK